MSESTAPVAEPEAKAASAKPERKKLTEAQKQALKDLKTRLGEAQAERLKTHQVEGRKTKKIVRDALAAAGPATVPELTATTGLPSATVLWQITAMKKYGVLREKEIDGDYPRYELI